jgi:hypothetical protein
MISLLCSALPAQKQCNFEEILNANVQKLDGYKFIRFFPVERTKQADRTEYSYLLNRDTRYRMVLADTENKGDRMMVTVRDRDKKVLATNKDKQKRGLLEIIDFTCPATGIYFFEVRFEDGSRDCGINILGYQK